MAQLFLQCHKLGSDSTECILVKSFPFRIGRCPDLELPLEDRSISWRHCQIEKGSADSWIIKDLDSKNGLTINNTSMEYSHLLVEGDTIKIGNTEFDIIIEHDEGITLDDDSLTNQTVHRNLNELKEQWLKIKPEKTIKRLKDVLEITNTLNGAQSIDEIFNRVEAVVFRHVPNVERLVLLRPDKNTKNLKILQSALQGGKGTVSGISISIAQKVFDEKVAIASMDTSTDQQFNEHQSIMIKGIKGIVAVPLIMEEKPLGVLYADTTFSIVEWGDGLDELLGFFTNLANLVATSLQRWIMSRELQEKERLRETMERELALSKDVQAHMFPRTFPEISNLSYHWSSEAAGSVGGDYFDVILKDQHQMGLVMSDISGKGISAALMMTNLQALFRTLFRVHQGNLCQLVDQINQDMYISSPANRYATFFYGIFNNDDLTFTYVNAGHLPPLILRNGDFLPEISDSPIVGLLPDPTYKENTLQFEAGDIMVLFTDGITEAMTDYDDEYEMERLKSCILKNHSQSPKELLESILDDVQAFTKGHTQSDDTSIFVAKIKS